LCSYLSVGCIAGVQGLISGGRQFFSLPPCPNWIWVDSGCQELFHWSEVAGVWFFTHLHVGLKKDWSYTSTRRPKLIFSSGASFVEYAFLICSLSLLFCFQGVTCHHTHTRSRIEQGQEHRVLTCEDQLQCCKLSKFCLMLVTARKKFKNFLKIPHSSKSSAYLSKLLLYCRTIEGYFWLNYIHLRVILLVPHDGLKRI
jgi:hypothetical protein